MNDWHRDGHCIGHSPGELVGCEGVLEKAIRKGGPFTPEEIHAEWLARNNVVVDDSLPDGHMMAISTEALVTAKGNCRCGAAVVPSVGPHKPGAQGCYRHKPLRTYDDWPHALSIGSFLEVLDDQRAVDRTFENEVRLNPRKAKDWVF